MKCFYKPGNLISNKGKKTTRDIVISEEKTEIRKNEYKGRDDIEQVVIPEGVTQTAKKEAVQKE